MERISDSVSLITLGFSELYLAITEILVLNLRKATDAMLRPAIFTGALVTLLMFIVGVTAQHNTQSTIGLMVSNMSPSVNEFTTSINNPLNVENVNYLSMNIDSSYLLRRELHSTLSRGGPLNRVLESNNIPISQTSETLNSTQLKMDINQYTDWSKSIGDKTIQTKFGSLVKCNLPSDYGNNIDFSTFKPYENYKDITAKGTPAYKVTHADAAYNDGKGFRRYYTRGVNEFTINNHMDENGILYGDDDYIVALGSYYIGNDFKEGQRFLVVGENGMYTVKIGDQKADQHTDSKHMYSPHNWCGKSYAGLIEFIVNTPGLEPSVKNDGTVNSSSVKALSGEIKAIYRIDT